MSSDTIHWDRDVDLHYSPDDGGWYAKNYKTDKVSKRVYDTAGELQRALRAGSVRWES